MSGKSCATFLSISQFRTIPIIRIIYPYTIYYILYIIIYASIVVHKTVRVGEYTCHVHHRCMGFCYHSSLIVAAAENCDFETTKSSLLFNMEILQLRRLPYSCLIFHYYHVLSAAATIRNIQYMGGEKNERLTLPFGHLKVSKMTFIK